MAGPLGQQGVPEYFQQPAKATTENVSVMRGSQAQDRIQAVREEIDSFKRLGVCEEVPRRRPPQRRYLRGSFSSQNLMSMVDQRERRLGL